MNIRKNSKSEWNGPFWHIWICRQHRFHFFFCCEIHFKKMMTMTTKKKKDCHDDDALFSFVRAEQDSQKDEIAACVVVCVSCVLLTIFMGDLLWSIFMTKPELQGVYPFCIYFSYPPSLLFELQNHPSILTVVIIINNKK